MLTLVSWIRLDFSIIVVDGLRWPKILFYKEKTVLIKTNRENLLEYHI